MTVPEFLAAKDMLPSQFAKRYKFSRASACRWARGVPPGGRNIKRLVDATRGDPAGEITANDLLGIGERKATRKRRAA